MSSSASGPGAPGRAPISISPPSATRKERDRLAGELKEHGLRLAAVNGAGNLLHPDPAKRKDAQTRFRAAVDLAVDFGVKRVVTMSGCPAGAGRRRARHLPLLGDLGRRRAALRLADGA